MCVYACVRVQTLYPTSKSQTNFRSAATSCLLDTIRPCETARISAHIRDAACAVFITASKTFSVNSHHTHTPHTHTSGLESSHTSSPANQTAENIPQRETVPFALLSQVASCFQVYFRLQQSHHTHIHTHTTEPQEIVHLRNK